MRLLFVPMSILAAGIAVALVVKIIDERHSVAPKVDQCASDYRPTIDDAALLGCYKKDTTRCCIYRGRDHENNPCRIVMCQMDCGPWKYASVDCYEEDSETHDGACEEL